MFDLLHLKRNPIRNDNFIMMTQKDGG